MQEDGLGRVCAEASLSPGGAVAVAGAAPSSGERRNRRSVSGASAGFPLEIKCVTSFELNSLGNIFYNLKQN